MADALRGGLTDMLTSLERKLVEVNAPIVSVWAPGLLEEAIVSRLEAISFEPSKAILEWFGWHDGTRDGLLHQLGAIPVEPLTLDQAVTDHMELRALALEIWIDPADADNWWPATLFPVAILAQNGRLGLWDQRDPRRDCFAASWPVSGLTEKPTPVATLAELVEQWLAFYADGTYGVEDGRPVHNWDRLPLEWRRGLA